MSWIARTDLCRLIGCALVEEAFTGAYNATAPNPVRMREFCSELGRVLQRPSLLPVPGPILKVLLGDGATVVLEGQKVLPKRLCEEIDFKFVGPDLATAFALVMNGKN